MLTEQAIKINMLLIEDENKWINVFKSIIENEEHIFFRSARSSGLALELVNDINEINLVVVDYELGTTELTGDALIRFIKAKRPDISIICWSAYPPTPSKIDLVEKLGAIGFISKGVDDKTILDALNHVRQNNKFFLKLATSDVIYKFTPVQRTILEQLAEGKDYEAIAKHFLKQDYHEDKNSENYVDTFEEYLKSSSGRPKFPAKDPEPEKKIWDYLLPSLPKNPDKGKPNKSNDEKNSKQTRLNGKKNLIENHIQDIKDRIVKHDLMKIERKEITFPILIHFAFDHFSNTKRRFSPEKILGIIFLRCHLDGKSIAKIAIIYSMDSNSIEKYLAECIKDILKKLENGEKITRVAMELELDEVKLREYLGNLFMKHSLNGESSKEIARIYSIDQGSVEQLLQEIKGKIIKKVKSGESIAEIAAGLDLDEVELGKLIAKWLNEDR